MAKLEISYASSPTPAPPHLVPQGKPASKEWGSAEGGSSCLLLSFLTEDGSQEGLGVHSYLPYQTQILGLPVPEQPPVEPVPQYP